MKTAMTILAVAFLAVTPAAAKSAKSFAPGQHANGVHGASNNAPGHVKKRMHLQSARAVTPGHLKH